MLYIFTHKIYTHKSILMCSMVLIDWIVSHTFIYIVKVYQNVKYIIIKYIVRHVLHSSFPDSFSSSLLHYTKADFYSYLYSTSHTKRILFTFQLYTMYTNVAVNKSNPSIGTSRNRASSTSSTFFLF